MGRTRSFMPLAIAQTRTISTSSDMFALVNGPFTRCIRALLTMRRAVSFSLSARADCPKQGS